MTKKVLFVANTGFALFHFRLSLMKHLSDQGLSVVAVANDESDFAAKFAREGFRFINIPMDHKGKNPFSDVAFMQRLISLYHKESPDIVHHFTIKPVIFGSLAAKRANVPAVANTITGLGYVFNQGGLLKNLVLKLYKLALSDRPKVIFQNRDDFRYFVYSGIVKEVNARLILGSGINTDVIRPISAKGGNNPLHFIMVSRMLWSKGVKEFVDAAEIIKILYPEVCFTLIGGASGAGAKGNPDALPEEWLKKLNQGKAVKWMGIVSFEKVLSLLDLSDIFVAPSYYPEGIPKALIEAAAKGMPIITTNTPGCREVVVDGVNGLLIKPRDVDSLVSSLLFFIRHREILRPMGQASRNRSINMFDEKRIISQTLAVYAELGCFPNQGF